MQPETLHLFISYSLARLRQDHCFGREYVSPSNVQRSTVDGRDKSNTYFDDSMISIEYERRADDHRQHPIVRLGRRYNIGPLANFPFLSWMISRWTGLVG